MIFLSARILSQNPKSQSIALKVGSKSAGPKLQL